MNVTLVPYNTVGELKGTDRALIGKLGLSVAWLKLRRKPPVTH